MSLSARSQVDTDFLQKWETVSKTPLGDVFRELIPSHLKHCKCVEKDERKGMLSWSRYDIIRHTPSSMERLSDKNCRELYLLNAWADWHLADVDSLLAERLMPREYRWIAAVRTGMNPLFKSGESGGLFALSAAEAAKYGLRVSSELDERFFQEMEANAVVNHLRFLSDTYRGDPVLTMLAFVRGVLYIKQNGLDADGIRQDNKLRLQDKILLATIAYLETTTRELKCEEARAAMRTADSEFKVISCDTVIHLKRVSEVLNIKSKDLYQWNPHLPSGRLNPAAGADWLRLPVSQVDLFWASFDAIKRVGTTEQPIAQPAETEVFHIVKKGEVLGSIARMYGVRVTDIQEWNGLKRDLIYAGQKLILYLKDK